MRQAIMPDPFETSPAHFPASSKVRSIYLDQNIYGRMFEQGDGDWRVSSFGKLLLEARDSERAQVWISPTNVIETMQTSDPARRRAIADAMLELVDARRMYWGFEFEVIDELLFFLDQHAPGAVRTRDHVEYHAGTMRQIWLGGLALLRATDRLRLEGAISDLHRLKLTNQLLHARLASDANGWVDRMIKSVEGWETTRDNVFAEYDGMSATQLSDEVENLRSAVKKLDGKHLERLKKNRKEIAAAYGAIETGLVLHRTLPLSGSLELTIDALAIRSAWPKMQKELGAPGLPKEVAVAPAEELGPCSPKYYQTLEAALRVAGRALLVAALGYEVVIQELQKCVNDKDLPTEGLTFDADHAAVLKRVDIFVTRDKKFGETLKSLSKIVEGQTSPKHSPKVVATEEQLRAVLA